MPMPENASRARIASAHRPASRPTGASRPAVTTVAEAKFRANSVPIVGITE